MGLPRDCSALVDFAELERYYELPADVSGLAWGEVQLEVQKDAVLTNSIL